MIENRVEIIEKDGVNYEKTTIIEVKEDGTEVIRGVIEAIVLNHVESEPTQLDLIQAAVEKSNDELRQEGADALTLELIASGII